MFVFAQVLVAYFARERLETDTPSDHVDRTLHNMYIPYIYILDTYEEQCTVGVLYVGVQCPVCSYVHTLHTVRKYVCISRLPTCIFSVP